MNPIIVLIKKELKIEFRSLQGIVASCMLSFMILMSFKFSIVTNSLITGSGILWASILLTGLGLITHISTREVERGTLDILKLSPISRYQLFLGRMLGSLALLWVLSSIIFILYIIIFENQFDNDLFLAYFVVLVGCIGLSAVGTLAASTATPLHGGWMITSLFAIPILLFTVIEAAIRCTDSLISGSSDFELAFMLLVLYNAVFVFGGAWLTEISD
jgi:ABC-type transport system involved in cytochrome c biogenesis permease component|tara:strand:+ start:569 stop:1219 length:651 start_codon:yes stop_codon:yes gene_type:complete